MSQLVELIQERLSAARAEVAECEKALRALGVDEAWISGLTRTAGDTIRYNERPADHDPVSPSCQCVMCREKRWKDLAPVAKALLRNGLPKKTRKINVRVKRKKIDPAQILADVRKNGHGEQNSTRKDILLSLKFEPRALADIAAQAQTSVELARYHVKKLLAAKSIESFERAGETLYKVPNA